MTFREQFMKLVGERKLWAYVLALLAICLVGRGQVAVDGIVWALAAFCGGNALSYFGKGKGA